jgi:hypothetical protein
MGSARPTIRTVCAWATMVKGMSNRAISALQMKPLLVHFELEMALKKVLASPSSCSTNSTKNVRKSHRITVVVPQITVVIPGLQQ